MSRRIEYEYRPENLEASASRRFRQEDLRQEEMLLNIGPQHPAMHGVLRLEVITDGEYVVEVAPHIGYLHRCFEKHAEALSYAQIIPYIDRTDYLAAMNCEHVYAHGIEKILGLDEKLHPRTQFIRVLVAELNRLASHFVALGTYAMDIGAFTPFLWMMRDREHILRMLEWLCGARMLYNYIWVGGLYYDLPLQFEERCLELVQNLRPKLQEMRNVVLENTIFIQRTANIGAMPLPKLVNAGITGPMLRAAGLNHDLRKKGDINAYHELDFEVPIGKGEVGTKGDCWDRTWVRLRECEESLRLVEQCAERLLKQHPRTREYDPQEHVPRRVRMPEGKFYFSGETPRGELGFFIHSTGKKDIPARMKVRAPSFCNLSALPQMCEGLMLADLVAVVGSLDIVLGEVDR